AVRLRYTNNHRSASWARVIRSTHWKAPQTHTSLETCALSTSLLGGSVCKRLLRQHYTKTVRAPQDVVQLIVGQVNSVNLEVAANALQIFPVCEEGEWRSRTHTRAVIPIACLAPVPKT